LSATGTGYTTGWEGLNLSVMECELTWNHGEAAQYTTTMNCNNRRAHFSVAAFMRPDRLVGGQVLGTADQEGYNPFRVPSLYDPNPSKSRAGLAAMMGAAARGPSQTNIPDQMQGMAGDPDFQLSPLDIKNYRPEQQRKQTEAEKMRHAQHERHQANEKEPARRAAPHATDEQLMGTAMQGMQYFEEFPEELQSPQEQRRERAASHGSLREQRGIAPEEPKAPVDPQNLIGAGMAEELMNPRRQRRMQRERGPQPGLVPASDEE
jgi:hypothetical protein